MEPNDSGFRDLLKEWKAPEAPAALERKVLARRGPVWRSSGWRFLLSGYVRVPVPLACAGAILLLMSGWWLARQTEPKAPCSTAAVAKICNLFPVCKT